MVQRVCRRHSQEDDTSCVAKGLQAERTACRQDRLGGTDLMGSKKKPLRPSAAAGKKPGPEEEAGCAEPASCNR